MSDQQTDLRGIKLLPSSVYVNLCDTASTPRAQSGPGVKAGDLQVPSHGLLTWVVGGLMEADLTPIEYWRRIYDVVCWVIDSECDHGVALLT